MGLVVWSGLGGAAGFSPGGTAGGALTGTYPNPTIAANATIPTPTLTGTVTYNTNANGALKSGGASTELLTLSTSGTTTPTVGNLAPANARILAILGRVIATITTAINFTVKVTGGNVFSQIGTATTSNTVLTAGTTYIWVPSAYADQYNTSATTLTVTTNANPGAGSIRFVTIYETYTPPTA